MFWCSGMLNANPGIFIGECVSLYHHESIVVRRPEKAILYRLLFHHFVVKYPSLIHAAFTHHFFSCTNT